MCVIKPFGVFTNFKRNLFRKKYFYEQTRRKQKKNKKCVTVEPLLRTTSLQRPLFLADSPYIADIESDFFLKKALMHIYLKTLKPQK